MTVRMSDEDREWYPVECALIEWMDKIDPAGAWASLESDLNVGEPELAFLTVMTAIRRDGVVPPHELLQDCLAYARKGIEGDHWIIPMLESKLDAAKA